MSMFNNILLAIGLGLLLASLALALLLLNERRVRRSKLIAERQRVLGLPEGELVYEDADGQGESLSSSAYPLVENQIMLSSLLMAALCPSNSNSMCMM